MENLMIIGQTILYGIYFVGTLFLVHFSMNRRVIGKYNPIQEINSNNIALSFRRIGVFIGLSIGMYGVLGQDVDILLMLVETIMLCLFMFLGFIISNKVILHKEDNDKEILKNKISIGIVEFGQYIAIGILAYASFNGEGALYNSPLFFLLGQLLLVGIYYIYSKTIKFDIIKSLHENNIASAILVASIFIGYSIILKTAIEGPSIGLVNDLINFSISAGIGIFVLLLLANKIIDWLFLPITTIEEELINNNYSAMLITGGLKICVSIGISSVMI